MSVGGMVVIQSIYFRAKKQLSSYLASSIINSLIVWSILCVSCYLAADFLSLRLGIPVAAVMIAIALSLASALQGLYQSLLQIMEQATKYFRLLLFVNATGFVTSLILIVWVAPSLYSRIAGILIGALVGALIAISYFRSQLNLTPSSRKMKELLFLGAPIILHSSAMLMIAQTDKLLIASLLDLTQVGMYGVSAQFAGILAVLASGMSMAYLPMLYRRLAMPNSNDGGSAHAFLKTCILVMGVMLIIYIPSVNYLAPLILGSSFTFEVVPFVILAIGTVAFGIYYFFTGYFYYYKKTSFLAALTVCVAIINFIISYTLIPIYGINGAALGTSISYVIALSVAILFSYIKHTDEESD